MFLILSFLKADVIGKICIKKPFFKNLKIFLIFFKKTLDSYNLKVYNMLVIRKDISGYA